MISQVDFDPGDYHLRMLIEQMERAGRSEHAIVDAVRAASNQSTAAEADSTKSRAPREDGRGLGNWVQRLRPSSLQRTNGAVRC
jgi:hypothetical protein